MRDFFSFPFNTKIEKRFVLRFAFIIGFVVLIMTSFILFSVKKYMEDQAELSLSNRVESIYNKIDQRVEFLKENTTQFSSNELVINSFIDDSSRRKFFSSLVGNFAKGKDLKTLKIVSFDGKLIFSTDGMDISKDKSGALTNVLSIGKSALYLEKKTNDLLIISPIQYYNTTQGAIIAVYDFEKIIEKFLPNDTAAFIRLLNEEKVIYDQVHDTSQKYYSKSYFDTSRTSDLAKLNITLEMNLLEDVYKTPLQNALINFSVLGVVLFLISFLFALYLTQTLSSPIVTLLKRVQKSTQIGKDIKCAPLGSDDELEILAEAFDKKTKILAELNEDMKNKEFQTIFKTMQDSMIITDSKTKLLEYNDAFLELIGYNYKELKVKEFTEFVEFEEKNKLLKHLDVVLIQGYTDSFELNCKTKNNEPLTLNISTALMPDKQRILFNITDVTEYKNLLDDLKIVKNRLNEAQHIAMIGSWTYDIRKNVLQWSDEVYNIFELDKTEEVALNEVFLNFVHPEDREKVNSEIFHTFKKGLPFEISHKIVLKGGKIKYVRSKGNTTFDQDGQAAFLNGTLQDITKEKFLEDQIMYEKNFVSTIVESANAIIAVIDSNGVMQRLNRYGLEFVGFEMEQIKSKPFFWKRFIPDEIKDKIDIVFENARKGDIKKSFQNAWIGRDNEQRVFEWSNALVGKPSGEMDYLLTVGIDITQNKKLEQILIQAKNEAEVANKAKSTFLANMSHEIRTPLNAIMGFVDILKEESYGRKSEEYVNVIDQSTKTLLQIIEDVLDFSKIESGKLNIEKLPFDPKKEFSIISDLFREQCSRKGIGFYFTFDKEFPQWINTDPVRVKQILLNLLSNAVKFTPAHKNIYVNIAIKENRLYVNVKDEGKGIAKEKLEDIFEAFKQEDESTTRIYGGTGLGLAISKELSVLLGGELYVKSTLGEGSEFYFDIPITIEQKQLEDEKRFEDHSFEHLKLLLVEDNKANQMLMKVIFKKLGIDKYDVAIDGLEAVEAYQNTQYDLILMDENMPNMSGIEATKEIRKLEKESSLSHTPIVALTANAIKGDRERFLESGMDEYLTKPLNKEKLIAVLEQLANATKQ